MLTSCKEVQSLLPLFFDSELDSRQMRAVALHSATCMTCEAQLRALERVQEMVAAAISERVDDVDLSSIWTAVDARLKPRRIPLQARLRRWWEDRDGMRWWIGAPAFGAAAAALTAVLITGWSAENPAVVASAPSSSVRVDAIDASRNVALLSEADTLVLWVEDEVGGVEPVSAEAVP